MRHKEATEKLDIESLIVDLLACGLGSIVILFFIFSVKIIGSFSYKGSAAQRATAAGQGSGSGFVALIGDDGDPKKRMGAARIVEISGLSEANYDILKLYADTSTVSGWDVRTMLRPDSIYNSILTQTQVRKSSISFIIYANAMRKITFSLPGSVKNMLKNDRSINASLKIIMLEGKAKRGNFQGYYEVSYVVADLQELSVTFNTGAITTNPEKLLNVTGVK